MNTQQEHLPYLTLVCLVLIDLTQYYPPETGAILAIASSKPTVVANSDGSISVKKIMQVNLTADHRVIYGADAASFLKDLSSLIENEPETLVS